MKKMFLILTLGVIYSAFFVSCDNANIVNSEFVGEYEMTTEVITVYGEAEFDGNPIVKSYVSIYPKKGKLCVQTDCFGIPFASGDYPNLIKEKNKQVDEDEPNSNIEDVTPNTSVAAIMNGMVRSIVNGVLVESLPIHVKSATATKLVISNSRPFELTFVNHSGDRITSIDCHFEYEPIFRQNETLAWELSLIPHQPIDEGAMEMTAIKYKNILRKK